MPGVVWPRVSLPSCISAGESSLGQKYGLFQTLARSGRAGVLTLCLQGLEVSENPAHQSRGHCPLKSGQETRSCSLLHHPSPGITLACLHTWQELQERGKLARPQRSGSEAKGSVWATGQTWWGKHACGTDEGSATTWLGEARKVPPCPLWASVFPAEK